MKKMKKINNAKCVHAFILGTFDPIHNGHCDLAWQASYSLRQIYTDRNITLVIHIIPTLQNPNKEEPLFTFKERLNMISKAFKRFSLNGDCNMIFGDEIEETVKPKYTIELLRWLWENYNTDKRDDVEPNGLHWVLTKETYNEIVDGEWYKSDEILRDMDIFNPLIVDIEMPCETNRGGLEYGKNISVKDNGEVIYTPIHSSDIRAALEEGDFETIKKMVPEAIWDDLKQKYYDKKNNY